MELDAFTYQVLLMHQSTGRMPDLHGNPQITRQYDFKTSEDIIIEPCGKLWLTDVDMIGPLWSPDWIGGKFHMSLHARAIRKFRDRLGLDEVAKRAHLVGI